MENSRYLSSPASITKYRAKSMNYSVSAGICQTKKGKKLEQTKVSGNPISKMGTISIF
jgi:hypothetical protein